MQLVLVAVVTVQNLPALAKKSVNAIVAIKQNVIAVLMIASADAKKAKSANVVKKIANVAVKQKKNANVKNTNVLKRAVKSKNRKVLKQKSLGIDRGIFVYIKFKIKLC